MVFRGLPKELSMSEILSQSVKLYLTCFKWLFIPFLSANMMNAVLGHFTRQLMPLFSPPESFTEESISWMINYVSIAIGLAALLFVTQWVITTLVNGIAVKYSSDIFEKGQANFREGASLVLSRFPSLLAVGLMTGVLIASGLILFIVPGIVVAIIFSLTVHVIIIERLGVFESLRRSRQLVAHRWKKTFGILLLIGLLIVAADIIGTAISGFIGVSFFPFGEVITAIIMSFVQPLLPIALGYLYYSLLTKEKALEQPILVRPTGIIAFQPNFCYQCGQKVPSDAIFCPQCGKRLKSSNKDSFSLFDTEKYV
ncbi:MAG: YciC family protein [Candidatus Bathyarchaeia archaeon]